jgi:hypothetical protein
MTASYNLGKTCSFPYNSELVQQMDTDNIPWLGWFGGSIPAAGITLACQSIQSDWSWRLPLVFQVGVLFPLNNLL